MSPLALFQSITGGHHSTEFPSAVHTTESDSQLQFVEKSISICII